MNFPTIASMGSIQLKERSLISVRFHSLSQCFTAITVLFLLMVRLAVVKRTLWLAKRGLILRASFPTRLSRSTDTSTILPTTIRSSWFGVLI